MYADNKPPKLPLNVALRLLSNDHRRHLVTALERKFPEEYGVQIPAEEIITAVEWEEHRGEFHHLHFPQLEAAGVIRWDQHGSTIGKGPQFHTVWGLLRSISATTDDH